jgi:hypothetical protein
MNTKTHLMLVSTGLLALTLLAGCGAAPTRQAAPASAPAPAPAVAPIPAPAPAPVADPAAQARAEAVDLLGAAGSARQAGDLGIAWELGRQAVAKWPEYAEAQAFVKEVEAQKRAAESAAEWAARRAQAVQDRQAFLNILRDAGVKSDLIISVGPGLTNNPDEVRVTVGESWFWMPYQTRLQMAQDIWRIWAMNHTPAHLDRSYLRLVDRNGNEAGGSDWVGSMVRVPR